MVKCKATRTSGVGKCAVYEGSDDNFTDPFNNISQVRFHSDFMYPSIVSTVTGTVSLPSVAAWNGSPNVIESGQRYHTYQLFEHGVDGTPFVLGRILDYPTSGDKIALAGSVPIEGDSRGHARWLTLGADDTYVLLHEQTISRKTAAKPAIDIDYEIYVSDLTAESYDGDPPGGEILKITPTRIVLGEGRFDSDKRYMKKVDSGEDATFVGGKTLEIQDYYNATAGYRVVKWKYSNGDYEYARTQGATVSLTAVSFTGAGVKIKI